MAVLSFKELSRIISSSWKVLDDETRQYCYVVAEILKKRQEGLVEAGGMCCLPTTEDFIKMDYILPTRDNYRVRHRRRRCREYPGKNASMGTPITGQMMKDLESKDADIPPPQRPALLPCAAAIMPGAAHSKTHGVPNQPGREYPGKNANMDISRVVNVKLFVSGDAEIPPSPKHTWLPCAPISSGDVFSDMHDVPYRPGREYPSKNAAVGVPSTVREQSTREDSVIDMFYQYRQFQALHQDWATNFMVNDDLDRSNINIPDPTPSGLVSVPTKMHQNGTRMGISAMFDMWRSRQNYS
jgi:hypothetical protein